MDCTAISPVKQPAELTTLAEAINAEHRQAEAAINDGLQHARTAGELLQRAKSLCSHGEWTPWLETNFTGSARTARVYLAIAERWPQIEAKRQHAATLSIRGAMRLVAPAAAPDGRKRFLDEPLDIRQRTCRQWWDILASHTLMLDAAGWETERIADTLGVEFGEVDAILNPRPPQYDFANYPEAMARSYSDAVAEELANQLRWAYQKAQHTAEREGFSEVVPLLRALEAKQERLRASLDGSRDAIIRAMEYNAKTENEKRTWPIAMLCCITDDIRESLGIAPRNIARKMFLLRFVEWCNVIEEEVSQ